MQSEPKVLSPSWREAVDPNSGKIYYANIVTRETTWQRPTEEIEKELRAQKAKQARNTAKSKEDVWLERQDPKTGRVYYYNPKRRETSWFRPDDSNPISTGALQGEGGGGKWEERVDPATGRTYYYNKVLRKTSWVNPDAVVEHTQPTDQKRRSNRLSMSMQQVGQRLSAGFNRWMGAGSSNSQRDMVAVPGGQRMSANYSQNAPLAPVNKNNTRTSLRLGANFDLGAYDNSGRRMSVEQQMMQQSSVSRDMFANLRAIKLGDTSMMDHDKNPQVDLNQYLTIDYASLIEEVIAQEMRSPVGIRPWSEFVDRQFNTSKKGFFGGSLDPYMLSMHTKKTLSQPLLPMKDRALISDAIFAFKTILAFCGDAKTKKNGTFHANVLLAFVINTAPILQTEIYAQLIKQSTNNQNFASLVKVYQLLALMNGTIPPPADIMPFVKSHLLEAINKGEAQVRDYASLALLRMNRFGNDATGVRLEVPSFREIESVVARQPVSISISLVSATTVQMSVEVWTTVKDVRDALEHRFQIQDGTPFTLFEVVNEDQSERALEDTDRILDLLGYWEREVERHRATRVNEPLDFQFVYKIRLFFDINEDDTAAIELAYLQAVYEVLDQRYPCSIQDCITLAALEAQEKFGDFNGHDVFGDKLAAYIPAKFYDDDEQSIQNMKNQIYTQYRDFSGYDKLVCMINYLNYVKGWKYYGSQYFFADPVANRLLGIEFPSTVILGINAKGVLVIDPDGLGLICEYKFSEIVTWGFSASNFVLVVGNLVTSTKMFFTTDEGVEINGLIHAYLKKLSEAQPEEEALDLLAQQVGHGNDQTNLQTPANGFGFGYNQQQQNVGW